jgi:hypothetical protein
MRKARCTCGAYAVGSLIHQDSCDIREAERAEMVLLRSVMEDVMNFKCGPLFIHTAPPEALDKLAETGGQPPAHVCQWEDYEGLTQRFQYCSICDKKRGGNA